MLRVLDGGISCTIQDDGRFGLKKFGVPVSGAMDNYAYQCANLLLNNDKNCAAIEIIGGGSFQALCSMSIAICGAECNCTLNGKKIQNWSVTNMAANDVLVFGHALRGCCSYLAVQGGINTEKILGSRSTYRRALLGGIDGTRLPNNALLKINAHNSQQLLKPVSLPHEFIPAHSEKLTIRCVSGPQSDYFHEESLLDFFNTAWTVTEEFDRMGCRLSGKPIQKINDDELISQPLLPGAIQITSSGQPIVMLCDAQTCGGYPIIATVINCDLSKLARANYGDILKFSFMDVDSARTVCIAEQNKMQRIRKWATQAQNADYADIFINGIRYSTSITEKCEDGL